MAANKSSTPKLLPNKLIQALIHAVLEWILIILLLLDSLFFYLIARFANMFGLRPPCRWCSRLDHHTLSVQDKANISSGTYKDICEIHATQISKLAYCSDHSNLAELQNMCMECLSSSSSQVNYDQAKSKSHQSIISEIAEARSTTRLCSCCGATTVINNMDHPSLPLQLLKGGSDGLPKEERVTTSPGLCLGSESSSGASGRNTESNITSMKQEKGDCCGDINYEEHDNELLLSDVSSFLYHRSEDSDEEEEQDSSGAVTAALLEHGNPGENDSRKISTQEEAVVPLTAEDYHAKSGTENHTNEVIKAHKLPSDETPSCRAGLENYAMETKMVYLEDSRILSNEIESGIDHALTTEQLRSALQAERKARTELYAELEAERSASTIAANQTIAMITRLQEEKAAIKMEALQYQRMMEEQSEYDQEALRLLSELVSKREKEKEELEKEVDMFHQRVLRYEDKGKAILTHENEDSFGSKDDDSSNEDDSDMVLSIDLNHHQIEENNDNDLGGDSNQATRSQDISTSTDMVQKSVDMVLEHVKEWRSLDDSLTEFEQERLSIIHQLKELEQKLYILDDGNNKEDSDGEIQIFKDVKPIDDSFGDQGSWHSDHEVLDTHLCNAEVNFTAAATMFSTDHMMITENQSKTLASAAHGLLHLLGPDDGDVVIEQKMSSDCSLMEEEDSIPRIDTGKKKRLAIEKEVDHVYGRLHALEADREFLRHCVTSMTKGTEGIVLLQEILQHLRELKRAKICV